MTAIELAVYRGAIAALRRRQAVQAERADRATSFDEKFGRTFSRITGEGAIAEQLAEAYGELADELEREAAP